MLMAKISSRATYHKCLNDLVDFGYVGYIPSFNPVLPSQAYFKFPNGNAQTKFVNNKIGN